MFLLIYSERDHCHETTCFEGPHIPGRRIHISIQLNLSWKTTCLEKPCFYGNGAIFQDKFYCSRKTNFGVSFMLWAVEYITVVKLSLSDKLPEAVNDQFQTKAAHALSLTIYFQTRLLPWLTTMSCFFTLDASMLITLEPASIDTGCSVAAAL